MTSSRWITALGVLAVLAVLKLVVERDISTFAPPNTKCATTDMPKHHALRSAHDVRSRTHVRSIFSDPSVVADNAHFVPITPVQPQGQVTRETPFGKRLYELARQEDVQLFLEIGTWKGGGSSLCIAQGLNETSGHLITIEIDRTHWMDAVNTLRHYPVTCLLGEAVDQLSSREAVRADAEYNRDVKESEWGEWYEGEAAAVKQFRVPLLKPLCLEKEFDAILLDGGEFCGPIEFQITMDECRPRYIALHDTNTFKNKWARRVLMNTTSDYEMIADDNASVGWSLFRRRQHVVVLKEEEE
jgi:hypothetical protein